MNAHTLVTPNSQGCQTSEFNKSSKQIRVAGAKRGKTRAGKSRLLLVLLLIGRESGARFFSQSQTVAMQNQSNCVITFDTQLKTALMARSLLKVCFIILKQEERIAKSDKRKEI